MEYVSALFSDEVKPIKYRNFTSRTISKVLEILDGSRSGFQGRMKLIGMGKMREVVSELSAKIK